MRKRLITSFIALAFVLSSFVLFASCAKRQIAVSGGEKPKAEEMKPKETMAETKPAKEVKPGETEAYREKERESKEKLRELEKDQALADELQAFNTEKIYFDFDKSDLKPMSQEVLRKKADFLLKYPDYSVRIEGNCDERGTNEYNLALGERRANAAKRYLMALGIAEERILTISFGEERPYDPGHNESAWALNRRDEFKAIKL